MTDPFDFDNWNQKWAWRQAKAKEASRLSEDEIAFLDRVFAQRIKERLERQAATGDLHAGEERSFASGPLPDEGEGPPEPSPT